jgi:hypothetical protein
MKPIGSEQMELKLADLILRSSARLFARRASRRMAGCKISLVAVLRDARKSALLRTKLIDVAI